MRYLTVLLLLIVFSCQNEQADGNRKLNFPMIREAVEQLPAKENLWLFILAGQSNMAGRGMVEPEDTLSDPRIFSLDQDKKWVYAKEPLHFYEPKLTGLDCGLSFARELQKNIPDSVSIGLIPCAVGGSAVAQWNNDELYRGVKLLTNFRESVAAVQDQGIFKGILWHQGESDAHDDKIPVYKESIEQLFATFREITQNDSLPILVGELGAFREPQEVQDRVDEINAIIHESADHDENRWVISTADLGHKGDKLHFDANAQREMGIRFARRYVQK